jgi:hypothetical protein
LNSSTVFEELSNFRKLFCFHRLARAAISRQPISLSEALNYIPVFTPLATQSQFLFSPPLQIRNPRHIAPNTTNPALQQLTPMGMRL